MISILPARQAFAAATMICLALASAPAWAQATPAFNAPTIDTGPSVLDLERKGALPRLEGGNANTRPSLEAVGGNGRGMRYANGTLFYTVKQEDLGHTMQVSVRLKQKFRYRGGNSPVVTLSLGARLQGTFERGMGDPSIKLKVSNRTSVYTVAAGNALGTPQTNSLTEARASAEAIFENVNRVNFADPGVGLRFGANLTLPVETDFFLVQELRFALAVPKQTPVNSQYSLDLNGGESFSYVLLVGP